MGDVRKVFLFTTIIRGIPQKRSLPKIDWGSSFRDFDCYLGGCPITNGTTLYKVKIYRKIIMVFLLAVIPAFILSLCLNRMGEKKVSDEVSKLLESRVNHCLEMMEKDIKHMKLFMQNYTMNKNLTDLAYKYKVLDDYEKVYAINCIFEDFNFYKSTFEYVENIKVYIRDIDKCITYDAIPESPIFNVPDKEWLDMMIKSYRAKDECRTSKVDNAITIPFFYAYNDYIPMYIFEMQLSNMRLKEFLDEYFTTDYVGAMMISSDANWKVCNSDEKMTETVLNILNSKYEIFSKKYNDFLSIDDKEYLVINDYSKKLGISLAVYIEKSHVMEYTKPFQIWYWVLLIFVVVIVVLFSYWLFKLVYKPFSILVNSFRVVDEGRIDLQINNDLNDEFSYLYSYISDLVKKYNDTVKNYYEEKLIAQKNEMKFLQSQIKPHFLYNSFFILGNMLKMQDSENSFLLCTYLGEYFKFITKSWTDNITLEDEVEHTINYINIQKYRYMGRFEVQLGRIPQTCLDIKVPRLILQPIIENCFKHGFSDTIDGGIISIDFIYEVNSLVISVRDNGKGFDRQSLEHMRNIFEDKSEIDDITGMINVNRRIKLMYGGNSGLKLLNNDDSGAQVNIIINLDGEKNNV